jgi:pimeloyl-ACP methyl ester carboxylesterase
MSAHGRHRVVEGAGHFIQAERPDIVVAAILEVVDWSRAHDAGLAGTEG